jgi:hypothetical protein
MVPESALFQWPETHVAAKYPQNAEGAEERILLNHWSIGNQSYFASSTESLRLEQFTYCCERYSLAGTGFLRSKRVPAVTSQRNTL